MSLGEFKLMLRSAFSACYRQGKGLQDGGQLLGGNTARTAGRGADREKTKAYRSFVEETSIQVPARRDQ